jgi:hypothetical protein
MSIAPIPTPRAGDYVFNMGKDSEQDRIEAERLLKNQGCKQFRFEPLSDGRVIAHGYLRAA